MRLALCVLWLGVAPMNAVAAELTSSCDDQLTVRDSEGRLLVAIPMPPGAGWCMAWNHSVEGFEVLDCYRHVEGQMVLERSHLPDFAAGLDHVPGRGRQVSDGQGGYWINDIDEAVPGNHYRLRVGAKRVDHRLVSRGKPTLERLVAAGRSCAAAWAEALPAQATPISLSDIAAGRLVSVGLEGRGVDDHGPG
ncbi:MULTISPECIES: DUF1850 domain-containing protein [unclassified Halomonas]|uniref:DUF1850 domain-containing protein n=1 Tax=unclassified Halomonas TaxID=2609666 RepID=UPI001C97646B|nr:MULTISPECIES: DUF1850 domain-containing protein [unclassified Halomonas]MBY5923839.1 DUF1850 domain-containing protein [Halomonas sp. DP4Y7-2]MBY6230881.1 DUF1850 domain-containing protein [Halomonas sp. DP4Y7-1]